MAQTVSPSVTLADRERLAAVVADRNPDRVAGFEPPGGLI
jgi:hypothetical protein